MQQSQRNTYDFSGVYLCLRTHLVCEQVNPLMYANFVQVSEAEWTYFVQTLRSGEVLPQQEAYVGIQVGLEFNRPIPRLFAEQIRVKFGLATKMEETEAKCQQLGPLFQGRIVQAEAIIDSLEAKRV